MEEFNNIYDFNWLVTDINDSITFKLYYRNDNRNDFIGTYDVLSLVSVVGDTLIVRTANISDLKDFLEIGYVRFARLDNDREDNIVDIPLRKIYKLFQDANEINAIDEKCVKLTDIEGSSRYDDSYVNDGYVVVAYKIKEPSEELNRIIKIANKFGNMGLSEQLEAIGIIDEDSYQRNKNSGRGR